MRCSVGKCREKSYRMVVNSECSMPGQRLANSGVKAFVESILRFICQMNINISLNFP